MSASSRSFAAELPRMVRRASFAVLLAAVAAAPAATSVAVAAGSTLRAPQLPVAVLALAPQLEPTGEGSLRWLGLLVYHARLWMPAAGAYPREPYALELRYARALRGADIAARSTDEMRHVGAGDTLQQKSWGDAMRRIFPDVAIGDTLIGLAATDGVARFWLNGKPIGTIDDPAFAPAFFGIWLSPQTSAPGLRRQLLGQPE